MRCYDNLVDSCLLLFIDHDCQHRDGHKNSFSYFFVAVASWFSGYFYTPFPLTEMSNPDPEAWAWGTLGLPLESISGAMRGVTGETSVVMGVVEWDVNDNAGVFSSLEKEVVVSCVSSRRTSSNEI